MVQRDTRTRLLSIFHRGRRDTPSGTLTLASFAQLVQVPGFGNSARCVPSTDKSCLASLHHYTFRNAPPVNILSKTLGFSMVASNKSFALSHGTVWVSSLCGSKLLDSGSAISSFKSRPQRESRNSQRSFSTSTTRRLVSGPPRQPLCMIGS